MKQYQLKPEYKGLIIGRNHYVCGMITLDTVKALPEHYENYFNMGFDFCFEPVAEPAYKAPIKYQGVPAQRQKKNKNNNGTAKDEHSGPDESVTPAV